MCWLTDDRPPEVNLSEAVWRQQSTSFNVIATGGVLRTDLCITIFPVHESLEIRE